MKLKVFSILVAVAFLAMLLFAAAPPPGTYIVPSFFTTNPAKIYVTGSGSASSNPTTGIYTINITGGGSSTNGLATTNYVQDISNSTSNSLLSQIVSSQVWTNDGLLIHPVQGPTNDIAFARTNGGILIGTNTLPFWGIPANGEALVAYRDTSLGEPNQNEIYLETFEDANNYGFMDFSARNNNVTWDANLRSAGVASYLGLNISPSDPTFLLGVAATRTLLRPGAANDGTVPYIFDTHLLKTSGDQFEVKNNTDGVIAAVDYRGWFTPKGLAVGANLVSDFNGTTNNGPFYLAYLDGDHVLVSDPVSPYLVTEANPSIAEINFVDGVTSSIQAQLDAKIDIQGGNGNGNTFTQATIQTSLTLSNLTANRAAIINGQQQVTNSTVTATELGYVGGVTSALQTQMDAKQPKFSIASNSTVIIASGSITQADFYGFTSITQANGKLSIGAPITYTYNAAQFSTNGAQVTITNGVPLTNDNVYSASTTTVPETITLAGGHNADALSVLQGPAKVGGFDSNGMAYFYPSNATVVYPAAYRIFTQTADSTVTNITTVETSWVGTGVGSMTLPAGFWRVGRSVQISFRGLIRTPAAAGNSLIQIKAGSTSIATNVAQSLPASLAPEMFEGDVTITCRTNSATVGYLECYGKMIMPNGAGSSINAIRSLRSTGTVLDTITTAMLLDWTSTNGASTTSFNLKTLNAVVMP